MKVFVQPTGLHSRAMVRVANALKQFAPKHIEIVDSPLEADAMVLHVIGLDTVPVNLPYAVIQYCGSKLMEDKGLQTLWENAKLVWSYYDLREGISSNTKFLYAPLGVDEAFAYSNDAGRQKKREIDIMTSGTSTGPISEAISEVAWAVETIKGHMVHVGPSTIENMDAYPGCWQAQENISDQQLGFLYRNSKRVSGLRQVEGFELPAIEGFVLGARPVVFDRPEMRYWYDRFAEFIPPCHGSELIERLVDLLKRDPLPITMPQRMQVAADFSWAKIASTFWDNFLPTPVSVPVVKALENGISFSLENKMRRLLWVGDAVASTGFARGTHRILDTLRETWDVHVLGVNYDGDPHDYPYPIYPARAGGDALGFRRIKERTEAVGPQVVVLQTDPWHVQAYMRHLQSAVPVVGYIAVDGKNCRGVDLNGLTSCFFWTQFADKEARRGGYLGPSEVIPLGVDTEIYHQQDKKAVRERMSLKAIFANRGLPDNPFIVGVVGRNQWRKRLDLTLEYFAEWIHSHRVTDACLWMHSAPTSDDAWELENLAAYYGISDRVIVPNIPPTRGLSEETMCRIYNMFDCLLTTTLGEGMWLPGLEAAACGTPIIAPRWSAIEEFFDDAALLVPCTATCAHPNQFNTIGGVADKRATISALQAMYSDRLMRNTLTTRGLGLVKDSRFNWRNVGEKFREGLQNTLYTPRVDVDNYAVSNTGN